MQLTDQSLETPQVLATRMVPENLDDVIIVLQDNIPAQRMVTKNLDIDWEARRMVTHSDVPPHGLTKNNRNYLLRTHSGGLVGLLCSCLYYPDQHSSYIGSLYLCSAFRRQGIGSEIVHSWYSVLLDTEITETRVCVGLRNLPALHFWLSAGYDRVTKISEVHDSTDSQYASIELSRRSTSAVV